MGKKRTPGKASEPPSPEKTPAAGHDLSTTVKTLHEVAQSLATTTAQMAQLMKQMVGHASGIGDPPGTAPAPPEQSSAARKAMNAADVPRSGSASKKDEEARRFYERLEQTGQLVDVDDQTDLSALPPHITHIRRPDGSIERIGFSASPYTNR